MAEDEQAVDPVEEGDPGYKPDIPEWLRSLTYFIGVGATAAGLIFPDLPVLGRIALAIGFVASVFGVAYRPTR